MQNVTAASAAGGKDKFMLAAGFILGLTGILKMTGNLSRRFFGELILKPSDVQAIESPRPHGILQGVIAIPEVSCDIIPVLLLRES